MGKCNLLRPVSNTTGNFLMFSQYAQDLTKEYSQKGTYKVVPSHFYALNVQLNDDTNTAVKLGEVFQNNYEESCSYFRDNETLMQKTWTPTMARDVFWRTLFDWQLVSESMDEIQCSGDINIYSYEEKDGIGYNEIYCYIPNEMKRNKFECTNYTDDISLECTDEYIVGWADEKYRYENAELGWTPLLKNNIVSMRGCRIPDDTAIVTETSDESFVINSIVVTYTIYDMNNNVLYDDIPLGIYFTGAVNDETGKIDNTITKFVRNDDIYGQGTSYGLRILTRYLCMPNSTLYTAEVVETGADIYPEWASVIDKISESQDLMNESISKLAEHHLSIDEHLALFMNNKTNVPYIRNISGTNYWFVNGKNTGVQVGSSGSTTSNNIKNNLGTVILTNQNGKEYLRFDGTNIYISSDGTYVDGNDLNNLKTVAFTGDYNDLSNRVQILDKFIKQGKYKITGIWGNITKDNPTSLTAYSDNSSFTIAGIEPYTALYNSQGNLWCIVESFDGMDGSYAKYTAFGCIGDISGREITLYIFNAPITAEVTEVETITSSTHGINEYLTYVIKMLVSKINGGGGTGNYINNYGTTSNPIMEGDVVTVQQGYDTHSSKITLNGSNIELQTTSGSLTYNGVEVALKSDIPVVPEVSINGSDYIEVENVDNNYTVSAKIGYFDEDNRVSFDFIGSDDETYYCVRNSVNDTDQDGVHYYAYDVTKVSTGQQIQGYGNIIVSANGEIFDAYADLGLGDGIELAFPGVTVINYVGIDGIATTLATKAYISNLERRIKALEEIIDRITVTE